MRTKLERKETKELAGGEENWGKKTRQWKKGDGKDRVSGEDQRSSASAICLGFCQLPLVESLAPKLDVFSKHMSANVGV
ncbi:hypothetical protein CK203_068301 [Vitis vinifera]|uniref:Uncharacterized protein n=1 Tax=Vitis vinifera TaxID=29760 RepID=A0A438E1P9_VITVI|nr:hypothetical protein CK203_068301 [Vitis vinifera]